ncbi:Wzz/FepE/Etk N-terminal domain-containing protein [uncultured Culturomica sp.]|jgi:LPS O-antigen subunit length determinant protein (WzzB/FepE family)|uniref:Wzz/FepE/Etk N-terminal domain-containing protein n=1 Tax=uncultured Culturomica sp. TaxID=1926654 RepID=UPI0025992A06|nr:Wzz/FepE/Etk N-terminal domain-containing protein [uncultured Culturomica sp.]
MEQHVNTPPMNNPEQEIDLVEVIRKLWRNRKLILKVTVAFMILGVLVALFSAKEYTAGSTLVPQSSDKKIGGSLSGLAAMAGINLGDMTGGEVLSPKIYPKVLASIPFQKDIMYTRVKFEDFDEPVTVLDYYTNEEYQRFSLGKTIVKYTIGLPGVILKAIRGEQPEPEFSGSAENQIQSLSKDEKKCIDILKDKINLNLNEKDGYVQLSVDMPDAWSAAQLAERVQVLLQKYITEFKIEKVQSNLDFVQERYDEAKRDFEQVQEERAIFRDANKNLISAKAQTEQEKLDTRYNLALSIYTELAKQLEQAKIQVKETTPVFTIVDPVTVPIERSKPKRALICILFTFLGGFAGIGLVLTLPFLAKVSGNEKLNKYIKE